ncbi:MAG: hypothetical protein RL095_715 [Verrucomicrobiota bacterium]|jgi:hypothetical protein
MITCLKIIALLLGVYALVRQRRRKDPGARLPIALIAASALLFGGALWWEDYQEQAEARRNHAQSERYHRYFGQALAAACTPAHSGQGPILVITPPLDSINSPRCLGIIASLQAGVGARPVVHDTPDNPNIFNTGKGASWSDLSKVIQAHPECGAVIALMPLPYCKTQDDLIEGLQILHQRKQAFHLIGVEPYCDPLATPIKAGLISTLVLPAQRIDGAPFPDSFASLFHLIDAANLETLHRQYPDLAILGEDDVTSP